MGSAQSYVSSELVGTALTGLVIASAVGLGFTRLNNTLTHVKPDEGTSTSADSATKKGKKKKQSKSPAGATAASTTITPTELPPPPPPPPPPPSQLVYLSNTIPGQFDVNPRHHVTQASSAAENLLLLPKTKKPKRKKTKTTTTTPEDAPRNLSILPSDYHSESSSIQPLPKSSRRSPQPQSSEATANPILSSQQQQPLHNIATTSPLDTDSSWTQVGSKRSRKSSIIIPRTSTAAAGAESQSEASFTTTTSQKDDNESSPRNTAADDDTHDSFLLLQQPTSSSSWDSQNRIKKTIAEKMLSDPVKTCVEDMLETPENPSPSSRVNRINPLPDEKPVAGFSWADYEDVRVATDGGENDADGEDDGWGVVTSKRQRRINTSSSSTGSSLQPLKASETLTKRQRQNLQKREQQKAAKAEAESQRLAALANHKRELEKLRIQELSANPSNSKPSGGMKASVDQRGNLIWE